MKHLELPEVYFMRRPSSLPAPLGQLDMYCTCLMPLFNILIRLFANSLRYVLFIEARWSHDHSGGTGLRQACQPDGTRRA